MRPTRSDRLALGSLTHNPRKLAFIPPEIDAIPEVILVKRVRNESGLVTSYAPWIGPVKDQVAPIKRLAKRIDLTPRSTYMDDVVACLQVYF